MTRKRGRHALSVAPPIRVSPPSSHLLRPIGLSLCQRFSLTAADLADHWESFAVNHDGSKLGMASFAGFETEVTKSKVSSAATVAASAASTPSLSRNKSAAIVTPRPAGRR